MRAPSGPDVRLFVTSFAATLRDWPLSWRLTIFAGYAVASAIWTFKFVRPKPAGFHRLVAALPVTIVHSLTGLCIKAESEPLALVSIAMTFGLSVCKVMTSCLRKLRTRTPQSVSLVSLGWNEDIKITIRYSCRSHRYFILSPRIGASIVQQLAHQSTSVTNSLGSLPICIP
jgi:hypothetical protein